MIEVKKNIVTTISGNQVERSLCRKIGNEFYEMNVDCVLIDNKWYRKGNARIYFNSVENKYMKITPNTTTGICGYDLKDNSYTIGSFEREFENSFKIDTKRGTYLVADEKIFNSIPKVWDNINGKFRDLQMTAYSGYNKYADVKNNKYIYDMERLYNSESLIPLFSKVDNSKYTKNLLPSNNTFYLIDKYSFGLEIETSNGIIPEHKCRQLGLIPLRDGSIGGHEYTTIPMIGNKGINLLINQFKTVEKYCELNKECSLHVHFGNFEYDEVTTVRLYNLLYYLQDELGKMFPYYIYNTGAYKTSGKDYCKKFPKPVVNITHLYDRLSASNAIWNGNFHLNHPLDPQKNQKWNNNCRYYFCNMINIMFGESPKTVEFRMHTPTFNHTKVINWMFICMSILNFAEKMDISETEMKGISLKDVINYSNDVQSAEVINNYISERKEYFNKCFEVYSDTYGVLDLLQDTDVLYKTPYDVRK